MTIKQILRLTILLSIISLVTPFIWLKIGSNGYANYGPNVPDIYILGGTILGKDRSFWGIEFAYKFQLIVILFYIFSTFLTTIKANKKSMF